MATSTQVLPPKKVTIIPPTITVDARDVAKRTLRVCAYCRVSTNNEEQISSYKSQIEYYTTRIEENANWKFAGIFADEGITGTSTKKRDQFNRMIRKCKKGRIDLILTKSISRFSRNTLDCLDTVRMLKRLGIGVVFEKENINTLLADDETLLTIFVSMAQAESESQSKNVKMGHRQSYKAGKVSHFEMLGYHKDKATGEVSIVPEEAEIVKMIFNRYLAGESVRAIARALEKQNVLTPKGKTVWQDASVLRMLQNEKYIGDAMLQKTYVSDMLTHTVKKNNGELPKYYVENNHPAIIDRGMFQRVQEEVARRGSLKRVASNAKTELSKYSSKYALTDLLVCGCCGAPYRRVTWTRPEGKKIVWRCINRLQKGGKRLCGESETLLESDLQDAIMSAISEVINRRELMEALRGGVEASVSLDEAAVALYNTRREIKALDDELVRLVQHSAQAGCDEEFYDLKFKKISDERTELAEKLRTLESQQVNSRAREEQVDEICAQLAEEPLLLTDYNDLYVRQLIDTVRVYGKERLHITFKGGFEMDHHITW